LTLAAETREVNKLGKQPKQCAPGSVFRSSSIHRGKLGCKSATVEMVQCM
jgi:hypothetical protein